MTRYKLWAYKNVSGGAKELAYAIGCKILHHESSSFTGASGKWAVINWGSTECPDFGKVLNKRQNVAVAADKKQFFWTVGEKVKCVPFTALKSDVEEWLAKGHKVVCRSVLNGHSGRGITILDPESELDIPDVPLYTRYVPKEAEFRVHVVNKQVVDVQRKIRDPNAAPTNWQVRSHDNGFIFVRNGVELSDACKTQAVATVEAVGLDFGAVDILQTKKGTTFVLEVNTAPGLEGSTVQSYAKAFKSI